MRDELNTEIKQEVENLPVEEFEERVVSIDRVTRVVKGGRRLRFRATVVVGNRNGKVGIGVDKGNDVATAMQKAVAGAKKNMIEVNLKGTTIPHEVYAKQAGAKIFLKPASEGTGVIAGGPVRAVLEAAGVKDILSKMLGSNSKINNVYATMIALDSLKELQKRADDKKQKQVDYEAAKESKKKNSEKAVKEKE